MATSGREPRRSPLRNKVMTSFENLVVLADYQEALRDARKLVWRDRGEPAVELNTLQEVLEHALRGGIRSGMLGFCLRSGFNLFVLLFRIWKLPRHFRFSLIRHALLGQDSFRLAAMLGTFTALYKLILNALPIVLPPNKPAASASSPPDTPYDEIEFPVTMAPTPSERRRGRLSFRAQAHELWVHRRMRRWYPLVAGAIAGGTGILWEKKGRRVAIAQQLFVRGLQGSYNALSDKHNFAVPHGEAIVFALCCAQIMYAFILRPDTIPPSYNTWILHASRVPGQAVSTAYSLTRNGTFDMGSMEEVIALPTTTLANRTELARRIAAAKLGDFGPRYPPCAIVHPWIDSCRDVPLERFFSVARWMLPIYGALHLVPALLFKRAKLKERPWHVLARAGSGTMRSSAFLGVFVIIYQTYLCTKHNLHQYLTSRCSRLHLRQEWIDLLISRASFWIGGLLSGFSLFVEEKRRRTELAMYVLPKALESLWRTARKRGFVFHTGQKGEALLCAIGMGMVMSTYQNNPQRLSGLVRRILYQFVGPN